jgi:hypothetical protein
MFIHFYVLLCLVRNQVWQSSIPGHNCTFWDLYVASYVFVWQLFNLTHSSHDYRQMNMTEQTELADRRTGQRESNNHFFKCISETFLHIFFKMSRGWLWNNFLTWWHNPSYILAEIPEAVLIAFTQIMMTQIPVNQLFINFTQHCTWIHIKQWWLLYTRIKNTQWEGYWYCYIQYINIT